MKLHTFIFSLLCVTPLAYSETFSDIGNYIADDYANFYESDRLLNMGAYFVGGSIIANTKLDHNIANYYQENIRSSGTDKFSKFSKQFGEGKYLLPLSFGLGATTLFRDGNIPQNSISDFGLNATRAYLVGLPAMLLMQKVTGGSRPIEPARSKWKFFKDNNGVSGHAFVGAVPFLTLAKMTDNKWIKYGSYAASTLTAWSRVNDNYHYTSQILLGYLMAYESVEAVFDSNSKYKNLQISPMIDTDAVGVQLNWKF